MNPNYGEHHRRLVRIGLSMGQYNAIMNTRCPGARLVVDLGFKPKLSPSGKHITFEAQGTEEAAEEVYYWADFCCP